MYYPIIDKLKEYISSNPKIQTGTYRMEPISVSGGAEQKFVVTFQKPFESAPKVFLTAYNDVFVMQTQSVTTTGFTGWARNVTSSSQSFFAVDWLAISEGD